MCQNDRVLCRTDGSRFSQTPEYQATQELLLVTMRPATCPEVILRATLICKSEPLSSINCHLRTISAPQLVRLKPKTYRVYRFPKSAGKRALTSLVPSRKWA